MEDVQMKVAEVPLIIDQVGIRGVRLPLAVRDGAGGSQHTVATVDLGVDLPARCKGTHMSRFVEALEAWDEVLDQRSLERLLREVGRRLEADRVGIRVDFSYFRRKAAPSSGLTSLLSCECSLQGELATGQATFKMAFAVPVMTVCPCSKAISREGAHSQRALIRVALTTTGTSCWFDSFITMAEASGSSALFSLLKREDEKWVTETAFANPAFVEDVARRLAQQMYACPQVSWFELEVESAESIHAHSAFARMAHRAVAF